MAIRRMDNVLIVVEDLDAVIAFFVELGVIGLDDVVTRLRAKAPNSWARWNSSRTSTGSATSAAPRASSSVWRSSSAEGAAEPDSFA